MERAYKKLFIYLNSPPPPPTGSSLVVNVSIMRDTKNRTKVSESLCNLL